MITFLVLEGWDYDLVMTTPLPQVNAMVESTARVKYGEKVQDANVFHAAAQGTSKDLKKLLRDWIGLTRMPGKESPAEGSAAGFLQLVKANPMGKGKIGGI